jgi:hypothetical protein
VRKVAVVTVTATSRRENTRGIRHTVHYIVILLHLDYCRPGLGIELRQALSAGADESGELGRIAMAIKRAFPKGPRLLSEKPRVAHAVRDEDHESNLAWDLVEKHRDTLTVRQRDEIFLKLGCRDFVAVISDVLESIGRTGHVVDRRLAERLTAWLPRYREHAAGARLRTLVDRCIGDQGRGPITSAG